MRPGWRRPRPPQGREGAPLALLLAAALFAGCGGGDDSSESDSAAKGASRIEDPGPLHVHGLGVDPADGALLIATHTGLFRAAKGRQRAARVGDRLQDTMGFSVVGPNQFLGSGHPDGREELPPFLGLIRSADGGSSWEPVSLLGKRDFHVLEAAGERVYGFGSDFDTREQGFLISRDRGRSWSKRDVPEPLISLALSPEDPERLLASGQRALYLSEDAGRGWRTLEGPAGLVAWDDRVVVVDGKGVAHSARDPDGPLRSLGDIGGQPAALEAVPRDGLYVALHDGTIKRSRDGGRTWTIRSRP